jgi:acyl-CoA synthetase (AMP-forming)/AMP-acid ligase II/thioesterase domain-containing protein
MFFPLKQFGRIEDCGLSVRWDAVALTQEVERRAAALSQMGIGRGSTVAIALDAGIHFFVDLFAAWAVGSTVASLDSALTEGELKRLVHFAKAAALRIDREGVALDDLQIPILRHDFVQVRAAPRSVLAESDPSDPALVLFTSGTTGSPKGVVLSFGALAERVRLNIEAISKSALARTLVTLPTHFGHGLIGNALTPLIAGGDIVLYPRDVSLAVRLGNIVDKHGITFMSSVPALWRMATRFSPPSGDSLVRVHVGSAPLSAQLWSDIAAWSRAEVVNCYGMTETANWIAGASSRVDMITDGLVGRPWGGTAAVVDDQGVIQGKGEGEIVLKSPTAMSGYLNRPDLTEAVLRKGWFHTGDRGKIDNLGRIWLTGRIKDEINRAGFKVQPAEIDMLLEGHPAIDEACVFAIPDPISGESIGAAIRLARGATVDTGSLRSWCLQRVRKQAVPEHWFIVNDIPRNARGKVSRDTVRGTLIANAESGQAHDQSRAREAEVEFPSGAEAANDTTTLVRTVLVAVERAWTGILGKQSFGMKIRWDEAGGDSLDTMRLWLRLEETLRAQIPLDLLDSSFTPNQLAAAIVKHLGTYGFQAGKRIVVFLMPGAAGDLPDLARFRRAFGSEIWFITIRYPPWHEMLHVGAGFALMVNSAVEQVLKQCDEDPVLLAGHSFGGFVAWEVARRLVDSGHSIGFLGLIDTRRENLLQLRRSLLDKTKSAVRLLTSRSALSVALQSLISFLCHVSAVPLLRAIGALATLLPEKVAFNLHWHLVTQLRYNALQRWTLRALKVPAILFRSDDQTSDGYDYGWGALCSDLSIIHIGGSHDFMLNTHLEILHAPFLEAVQLARRTQSRTVASPRTGERGLSRDPILP